MIVFEDADIAAAVDWAMIGIFVCVRARVKARVKARARGWGWGWVCGWVRV